MEEDTLASVFLWLHITGVITFGIGLVGSFIMSFFAGREKDVKVVQGLVNLGKKFTRFINIGGAVFILAGLSTAWREEVPILGFLQGGEENWLLVSIILFISTFPAILLYIPREKVINKELETAVIKGQITPELENAFANRTLRNGQIYEITIYAVIVFLMVVKPF
jgi:uncharacterized membrane protein